MESLKEKLEYLKQTNRIVDYEIINENTYSIQPVKAADKIIILDAKFHSIPDITQNRPYKEKENKNDKHKL